jgi:hypothetical protein
MNTKLIIKILVVVTYVAMVTVNYLANALPIGGVTTGEASDAYPNLFTPAGVTFSIWGLIYLLLGIFVIFFCLEFGKKSSKKKNELLEKTGQLFIINALANIAWIFAWHYGLIIVSVFIMLVILGTLIMLADLLNKEKLSWREKGWLLLPFSVYFGWITVATIANISVLLVSLNWDGFGIAENIWTVIVLLIGATIGIWRSIKDKNVPYILVLVWAYGGILLKHTAPSGFEWRYHDIINTVIICIVLFLLTAGWLTFQKVRKAK